jgi:DNA-binding GntR family transcriptional regulator
MSTAGPRANGQALVERLAGQLEARIVAGELAPGARLRQEALAAELGVSRTPIREALRQLHSRGLVTCVPNVGAIVRGPTPQEVRQAYQVRAELEGLAAELAAANAADDQLLRLREAERLFRVAVRDWLGARRHAGTGAPAWYDANDAFHEAVLDAAANPVLARLIHELHVRFPRNLTWPALARDSRRMQENAAEHRAIRTAIERRDGAEARRLICEHVRNAGELVATGLERDAGGG